MPMKKKKKSNGVTLIEMMSSAIESLIVEMRLKHFHRNK